MSTPYHAAYWANALSVKGEAGSLDSITRSLGSAKVDLNPHQVDAALFAIRSPFSKGVVLADEVGLGKTIEAGIVLTQRWAERKRRILLIVPATLRKQWQSELEEKFAIPSVVVDGKSMKRFEGDNALERDGEVVIVSYPFAARHDGLVRRVPWDLVVADEAHRLRNVYKASSKQAAAIKAATAHAPKLLLTATPLQNSLLELYGLVSILDEHAFGDVVSFREQFTQVADSEARNAALKARLAPYVTRTLRRQVLEYVRFTRRVPLTQGFTPYDDEQALYDGVTHYMEAEALHAIPNAQRALITLVLRKLLASSTFAIAHTLGSLSERALDATKASADGALSDYDPLDETEEEWDEAESADGERPSRTAEQEHSLLKQLSSDARSITRNAKGDALLSVLPQAFEQAQALGAARKAVVFTESRRTQQYLKRLLESGGYAGEIVCINGTNTDPDSRRTYSEWKERHAGTSRVSGSRGADIKAALVEEFRDRGTILLATESAAEGVNLQFCSLVVNYDLPWNPQRVEQRIGRCHRYGQKHDVVVVNFLNEGNAADRRVFELLSEKFALFDGVFGASDEILGTLESGVDLEKRIIEVYRHARTDEEIQQAFDQLQAQLDDQIQQRMGETRTALLDHFDQEVHARLKMHHDTAQAALDEQARFLLRLTRYEIGGGARFDDDSPSFALLPSGDGQAVAKRYTLDWRASEREGSEFYHAEHPMARKIIEEARARPVEAAHVTFDLDGHRARILALEPFKGASGWLSCSTLRVSAKAEDEFLILAGTTDDGRVFDSDLCAALLGVDGETGGYISSAAAGELATESGSEIARLLAYVDERNGALYEEEASKLDAWADDLKVGLEAELKDLDREIRDAGKSARSAVGLRDKLEAQKHVKSLEARRSRKRRTLYEAQDDIDRKRDVLIGGLEADLESTHDVSEVFIIRWTIK